MYIVSACQHMHRGPKEYVAKFSSVPICLPPSRMSPRATYRLPSLVHGTAGQWQPVQVPTRWLTLFQLPARGKQRLDGYDNVRHDPIYQSLRTKIRVFAAPIPRQKVRLASDPLCLSEPCIMRYHTHLHLKPRISAFPHLRISTSPHFHAYSPKPHAQT